ncbi:MAG: nicotinate-nucleotide adenylyltransferase [Bacteroidaceae bacterium]|nr:nicotinate-nucleotide adenylyltransferase [Bacteroidaceae bacterium]
MIALLGGSFNPIHKGHTGLARWIVTHGYADKTWLMVSPHNPLKAAPELADEALRLRWTRLACEHIEGVEACDFEFTLPRPSYTYQTLQALRGAYPQEHFALAIGADNWLCFNRWKNYEWILANVELLVYPRQGYDIDATTLPHRVQLIPAPLFPQSSTTIRQRIKQGEDVSEMLAEDVWHDIKQRKSYL